MENEKLNRELHEAMGRTWPDPPNAKVAVAFPDYCNSVEACLGPGGLVEWMRKARDESFEISSRGGGWTVLIFPNSYALLARKVEILEKCAEHYADKDHWSELQREDLDVIPDVTWYIGSDTEGREYGFTVAQRALEAVKVGGERGG